MNQLEKLQFLLSNFLPEDYWEHYIIQIDKNGNCPEDPDLDELDLEKGYWLIRDAEVVESIFDKCYYLGKGYKEASLSLERYFSYKD